MEEDLDKNLKAVLNSKLGLSGNAVIEIKPTIGDNELVRPDLIIRDGKRIMIVEVKKKIDIGSISKHTLFQRLIKDDNVEFIIASIIIPDRIRDLAEELDINVIQVPPGIVIREKMEMKRPRGKITSRKSWKVLTRVLIEGITSIRNVSMKEKISYAWTHKTMTSMIDLGIMEKDGDLVKIADMGKALNMTAFERPFNEMKIGEMMIPEDMDLKDLEKNLTNWKIEHSFTGYTAASAYTGYGIRHDSVYFYINNRKDLELLRDIFEDRKDGYRAIIYYPDRDVFSDSTVMNMITYVSPDQTLMDMAGLGYSGMDLTLQMVKEYANIRSDH